MSKQMLLLINIFEFNYHFIHFLKEKSLSSQTLPKLNKVYIYQNMCLSYKYYD